MRPSTPKHTGEGPARAVVPTDSAPADADRDNGTLRFKVSLDAKGEMKLQPITYQRDRQLLED